VEFSELQRILSAVFNNANKFTNFPGTIKIEVFLSQFSRYIMFRVSDSGPGIPESFRPRLFRAFSQEDGSLTREKEGLGLGLMVALGNARRLKGDIKLIESHTVGPKRGSIFEINLPLQAPHHNPRESMDPENSPPVGSMWHTRPDMLSRSASNSPRSAHDSMTSPTQYNHPHSAPPRSVRLQEPPKSKPPDWATLHGKLSFLIAEDNAINRRILVALLKRLGHTSILTANDGREAVRAMENLPASSHVDVVLMDLWMPHMDGYEACQHILALPRFSGGKVTVMAVSADVTAEALERAAAVGMEGYMTKPYKIGDLEKLLNAYLASRKTT
jgi:CheY-like chemotaxis protein